MHRFSFLFLMLFSAMAHAGGLKTAHTTSASTAPPSICGGDPSWVEEQPPVRVYGNTWHVGPRGLGVILITAPTGDILIDGGVPKDAGLIERHLRRMGVRLHDVKWILSSHAHCDHAGGIAQLARDSGAQVIAGTGDVESLASGGHNDPQFGDRLLFPPVQVARIVGDNDVLQLGQLTLTAHATPGHTRGNTTWSWRACERRRCLAIVFIGSLSAPGYTLKNNPRYPQIIEDYRRSFATVAALPCDIALASHPDMVDFWDRVAKRRKGDAQALIDPTLCRAYADAARESFEDALKP